MSTFLVYNLYCLYSVYCGNGGQQGKDSPMGCSAKSRLADNYGAAQERGEVQKHDECAKKDVQNSNVSSADVLIISTLQIIL